MIKLNDKGQHRINPKYIIDYHVDINMEICILYHSVTECIYYQYENSEWLKADLKILDEFFNIEKPDSLDF